MTRAFVLSVSLVCGALLAGCASSGPTTRPASPVDRAKADPMHYSVDWEEMDISGGGLGDYNHKAMQRDLNDIFNP